MYYDKKDTLVLSEIDEVQILHFKNKEDQRAKLNINVYSKNKIDK